MHSSLLFCLLLAIFLLSNNLGYAKTITIPGDANSIQEAVELAVSGDEIVVATEEVKWTYRLSKKYTEGWGEPSGVIIQNKNLAIRGGLLNRQTRVIPFDYYEAAKGSTFLRIEGSQVLLENLHFDKLAHSLWREAAGPMEYPFAAPFRVESGSLSIDHSTITGYIQSKGNLSIQDSTIYGYSFISGYAYIGYSGDTPSIELGPAQQISFRVKNSTISSDSDIASGYQNILIQGMGNSTLEFQNSQFIGGESDYIYGSTPQPPGSNGATIRDCSELVLSMTDCLFQGGDGHGAGAHRHETLTEAGPGGSGLSILNSSVQILENTTSNQMFGGNGGSAMIYLYPGEIFQKAANRGGHGVEILQSRILLSSGSIEQLFQAKEGAGGLGDSYKNEQMEVGISLPPGPDGLPIYIDENSSIETVTPIITWELY